MGHTTAWAPYVKEGIHVVLARTRFPALARVSIATGIPVVAQVPVLARLMAAARRK